MRFSSANAAAGLVIAGYGVAVITATTTFPRAESGPGYLAVPVGTIPRTHQAGKRAANAIETTLFNLNFFYAAQLGIGTPPQNITVLVDTGSSELWVNPNCRTARQQDRQQCTSFGQYNPRTSQTPPVGPFGSETINFGDVTDESTLTSVDITYFADNIAFGDATLQNQTFGVVTQSQGQSQGIMGLAPDLRAGFDSELPYSLVLNSMAQQGVIASRVFALDLRHSDVKTGAIIYGGVDRSKFIGSLERLPIIKGLQGEFRLAVTLNTLGMTVTQAQNYQLSGNDTNVMLDSGTTLSRLQPGVAMPLLTALKATTDGDGYFQVPCSMQKQPGSVDFGFGGTTIRVPFKDFIINVGDPTMCYVGVALTSGQQILGDTVLRAGYFVFDWDNEAVHIAQAANCGDSDIVAVGKGTDAVPSVVGNCKATAGGSAVSSATTTPTGSGIISASGSALPTVFTVTACPSFDPNCRTGAQTQTSNAVPTAGSSGGNNENGKSSSGSGDKKSDASRGYGAIGWSLLAVLTALSIGAGLI